MDDLAGVRKRRLSLGISLGELARAVGRSDATLSRIERGQIRPSYDLVQRILQYLQQKEGEVAPTMTARDVANSNVVTIGGESFLNEAALLMEKGGFSQLPVVIAGRITGAVSESSLLRALAAPAGRRTRVRDVQEPPYPLVDESCPANLLAGLLTRYPAVLVARGGELKAIVTKTDLIRGLRGTTLRRPPTDAPH